MKSRDEWEDSGKEWLRDMERLWVPQYIIFQAASRFARTVMMSLSLLVAPSCRSMRDGGARDH